MSEAREPGTEAGDRLLADLIQDHSGIAYHVIEAVRDAIPRIEAEARADALRDVKEREADRG